MEIGNREITYKKIRGQQGAAEGGGAPDQAEHITGTLGKTTPYNGMTLNGQRSFTLKGIPLLNLDNTVGKRWEWGNGSSH